MGAGASGAQRAQYAAVPQVAPMPFLDLERYAGTWYELLRYDMVFQRGCVSTSATYTATGRPREVAVLNQCYRTTKNRWSTARGRARQARDLSGRLKVTFLPWGLRWLQALGGYNYWVLGVADDYSVAVVSNSDRTTLWVLSRVRPLTEASFSRIVGMLRDNGFDTTRIVIDPQAYVMDPPPDT